MSIPSLFSPSGMSDAFKSLPELVNAVRQAAEEFHLLRVAVVENTLALQRAFIAQEETSIPVLKLVAKGKDHGP